MFARTSYALLAHAPRVLNIERLYVNYLQGRLDESFPLLERAILIRTQKLEEHHEDKVKPNAFTGAYARTGWWTGCP